MIAVLKIIIFIVIACMTVSVAIPVLRRMGITVKLSAGLIMGIIALVILSLIPLSIRKYAESLDRINVEANSKKSRTEALGTDWIKINTEQKISYKVLGSGLYDLQGHYTDPNREPIHKSNLSQFDSTHLPGTSEIWFRLADGEKRPMEVVITYP